MSVHICALCHTKRTDVATQGEHCRNNVMDAQVVTQSEQMLPHRANTAAAALSLSSCTWDSTQGNTNLASAPCFFCSSRYVLWAHLPIRCPPVAVLWYRARQHLDDTPGSMFRKTTASHTLLCCFACERQLRTIPAAICPRSYSFVLERST